MLVVHGTKNLRDRMSSAPQYTDEISTTTLGHWYATALFWRPQVALFVDEKTLLPVLVRLAPATGLVDRFVTQLRDVLGSLEVSTDFIEAEAVEMREWRLAKTTSRSVVGTMNEFAYLGRAQSEQEDDLLALSLQLSTTPCGPLYDRHVSPDRELKAFYSQRWSGKPDAGAG